MSRMRYSFSEAPEGHPHANNCGFVAEHILIAEEALGKLLPEGAHVHHVDCNPRNNTRGNLVVCEGALYHHLLHQRTRALRACGHADWRKCWICKQWSPVEALKIKLRRPDKGPEIFHLKCASVYLRRIKARKL